MSLWDIPEGHSKRMDQHSWMHS